MAKSFGRIKEGAIAVSEDIQLSLIPELVPESAIVPPQATSRSALSKPQKVKPISQGDLVETPTGDRAIVMLVNPLGDCYVEVKGEPFVYLASDLKRIGAIISPSLTLHQIYIELHAYRTAIEQVTGAIDKQRQNLLFFCAGNRYKPCRLKVTT